MANTLKFGNGEWYGKKDTILAYNNENKNYKPLPFNFDRASSSTVVNKEGLIETVGSGEPRIDYKDDSKGALLLEPTRTNFITYSEDFSNSYWTKLNSSIISNSVISPDGTLNADKIIDNTVNTSHRFISSAITTTATNYTFSIFVKKSEIRYVYLRGNDSGGSYISGTFDLQDGVVTETLSGNLSIQDYGNGWFRVIGTAISNGNGSSYFELRTSKSPIYSNYLGNGTDGLYVYGAQVEQGSYATSYIPTSGGIATRVGESCFLKNEYVLSNSSGSIFFELGNYETNTNPNGFNKLMVFNEVSSSNIDNVIYIEEYNGLNTVIIRKGGSTVLQTTPSYQDLRGSKISIKFSNTEAKVFINGVLNQTYLGDASLNLEHFGFDNPYNGQIVSSLKLKNLKLYNTALTDQELIALTS